MMEEFYPSSQTLKGLPDSTGKKNWFAQIFSKREQNFLSNKMNATNLRDERETLMNFFNN
jgi:hypothetical protein